MARRTERGRAAILAKNVLRYEVRILKRSDFRNDSGLLHGAGYGIRTHDVQLGKLTLYH